jgi:hypothetical protein
MARSSRRRDRDNGEIDVAQLTAHLLDGFDHDRVVLTVDGQVVDAADDVTTLLLLGAADSKLTTSVPDGRISVGIDVPTRGLATKREVEAHEDVHLLVSIQAGVLTCEVSGVEPGYM